MKTVLEKEGGDPSLHAGLLLNRAKANTNAICQQVIVGLPIDPPPTLTTIIEACSLLQPSGNPASAAGYGEAAVTLHLLQPPEEDQEEMAAICPGISLPPCKVHRLAEVAELITSARSSASHREKLALALKNEGYIPKLLELFQVCEKSQLSRALQHLSAIMQGILWLDQGAVLEVLLSQECIMDVVRCLEYDPSLAQPKWCGQLLQETTKLKELLPIRDPELQQKFHQLYWAQCIQAIILPKAAGVGEGSLASLTSFISCKREEIVHVLEKDQKFWSEVLAQLTAGATGAHQRWDLVTFLKDFCASSLMFHQNGEAFLQGLAKLGLLPALEILLGMDDLQVASAATDVLSYLVNFCLFVVQEFVMQEAQQRDHGTDLIRVLMKQMICYPAAAFGVADQVMELLQTLLDPGNLLATAEVSKILGFFNSFYTRCLPVLTAPLLANAAKDDYQTAQLLALILELLGFCVTRHKEHMRSYILHWDLLRRVLLLINSKHTFLALGALHFLRKIIALKDELYTRYIIQGNLLAPLVQALLENGATYNLLRWAVLELFEFLRLEDCKSLVAHVVENFYPALESITYVQTFQGLKRKYERDKHRQKQSVHRVLSFLGRGARASEQKEQIVIGGAQVGAAQTAPTSFTGSSSKEATPCPLLRAPKRHQAPVESDNDQEEAVPEKRLCLA
ncbi:serine/threonine-protein phosphatase 4 regulatory subunit 3B-like [Chamaea fasciata]|uniref:serine/threonine-protein phosphatase 4 regulatory subunit 3B-like n=1 Tax=Chamaea fasciata TaxID=190680 RepID=UPI00336A1D70